MTDLFVIAGEASGDQLGEGLLEALYKQRPDLKVFGIGGPKMRAVGIEICFPMEELQVMGFVDVALAFPKLLRYFRKTAQAILEANPPVVVTIDYPGFNLRLAKALRKKGFKGRICHYICPSVWAWGKKRIQLMADNLDLLLSVLPFEKQLFAKTSLRVEYIGHPLARKIEVQKKAENVIGFFPGSRTKEIERNLPFYVRLIEKLRKEFPQYTYVVSIAQEKYRPLIQKLAPGLEVMKDQKLCLAVAKSGTVTLELALKGIPTVVTYAISPFDIFLAKYIFRISLPFYALPNLIAGKSVFPELIGPALTDENLLREVKNLITNQDQCRQECQKLRALLGTQDANQRAAELILSL